MDYEILDIFRRYSSKEELARLARSRRRFAKLGPVHLALCLLAVAAAGTLTLVAAARGEFWAVCFWVAFLTWNAAHAGEAWVWKREENAEADYLEGK